MTTLLVVLLLAGYSAYVIRRQLTGSKKKEGCNGSCGGCPGGCGGCQRHSG